MTLDQFLAGASADLMAFAYATREQAKVDSTFYLDRDHTDWWREVAAYMVYVELEEKYKKE